MYACIHTHIPTCIHAINAAQQQQTTNIGCNTNVLFQVSMKLGINTICTV